MRKAMEQMLYVNGVDIFFSGHIHAYEVRVFGSAPIQIQGLCHCSGFERRLAKPAPHLTTWLSCCSAPIASSTTPWTRAASLTSW